MKIDYENIIFPWPILSKSSNDFTNNLFELNILSTKLDEILNSLAIEVELICLNEDIIRNSNFIESIIHIENRANRDICKLELNKKTTIQLNINDFCTKDSIEVIGLLICKNEIETNKFQTLDQSYLDAKLNSKYKIGDIVGFTKSERIDFIENYGFKDILRITKSEKIEVFEIDLNDNVINLVINEELFNILEQYNSEDVNSTLAKIIFIYPTIMSAITEIMNDEEGVYENYNWSKAISNKLSSKRTNIDFELDSKEIIKLTHLVLENMVLEVLKFNQKVS